MRCRQKLPVFFFNRISYLPYPSIVREKKNNPKWLQIYKLFFMYIFCRYFIFKPFNPSSFSFSFPRLILLLRRGPSLFLRIPHSSPYSYSSSSLFFFFVCTIFLLFLFLFFLILVFVILFFFFFFFIAFESPLLAFPRFMRRKGPIACRSDPIRVDRGGCDTLWRSCLFDS